jgi:hypothetical protein
MAQQLFRLGTTQWWVLVDTTLEKILDQYNKPQLAATISALETTIASQPDLSQMQQDYADLVALVKAQNIPQDRKDRVIQLLNDMFVSYSGSPFIVDMVQIRERLARLKLLYNQMEV